MLFPVGSQCFSLNQTSVKLESECQAGPSLHLMPVWAWKHGRRESGHKAWNKKIRHPIWVEKLHGRCFRRSLKSCPSIFFHITHITVCDGERHKARPNIAQPYGRVRLILCESQSMASLWRFSKRPTTFRIRSKFKCCTCFGGFWVFTSQKSNHDFTKISQPGPSDPPTPAEVAVLPSGEVMHWTSVPLSSQRSEETNPEGCHRKDVANGLQFCRKNPEKKWQLNSQSCHRSSEQKSSSKVSKSVGRYEKVSPKNEHIPSNRYFWRCFSFFQWWYIFSSLGGLPIFLSIFSTELPASKEKVKLRNLWQAVVGGENLMKLPRQKFQLSETWRFTWGFGDSSLMSLLNKNHLVKGSMVSNATPMNLTLSWAPYEKCVPFVSCPIDPLTTVPPVFRGAPQQRDSERKNLGFHQTWFLSWLAFLSMHADKRNGKTWN